jgi:NTE family protein
MPKINLVLGGGGTRGYAHIGLFKVLEEHNIKISAIAGCSMGAIMGACYAAGKTAKEIEDLITSFEIFEVINISFSNLGIKKTKKLQKKLEKFFGVTTFEELKIPLYINATDLKTGENIIFSKGNLFDAIRASISIPGIFEPVKHHNSYLVDGGVSENVPLSSFPKRRYRTIISNVTPIRKLDEKLNMKSIAQTSMSILQTRLFKEKLFNYSHKYVLIEPNVGEHQIVELKKTYKDIIQKGYDAAKEKETELIKLTKQKIWHVK